MRDLRDRLRISRKLANDHAAMIQDKTKAWYDRKCTKGKELDPGQKVIILEPDDSRKLFARWSEPKTVLKRVNDRNYEVDMGDGTSKLFHVNQLRSFKEPVEFSNAVVITADVAQNEEDAFLPIVEDEVSGDLNFKIETSLPSEQQQKLTALLDEFKDVFHPSLGKTHLAKHVIKLKDNTPCVRPSYRIPESLKKPFEEEVNRLISAGILRECESEYRSPIIPIRKADGSLRLVNDSFLLTSKTTDDLSPVHSSNEVNFAAPYGE